MFPLAIIDDQTEGFWALKLVVMVLFALLIALTVGVNNLRHLITTWIEQLDRISSVTDSISVTTTRLGTRTVKYTKTTRYRRN